LSPAVDSVEWISAVTVVSVTLPACSLPAVDSAVSVVLMTLLASSLPAVDSAEWISADVVVSVTLPAWSSYVPRYLYD